MELKASATGKRRSKRTGPIECWFDGACEPCNPGGTASFGAVVFIDGNRAWECSRIFRPVKGRERETSNNVAEYSGFKAILDYLLARELNRRVIIVRGDSNLVIQQMFGRWRIKQGYYVPLAQECKRLLKQFPNMRGEWIPREENGLADELSKRELLRAGVRFRIQPEEPAERKSSTMAQEANNSGQADPKQVLRAIVAKIGLAGVLDGMAEMCYAKASEMDKKAPRNVVSKWSRAGKAIDGARTRVRALGV